MLFEAGGETAPGAVRRMGFGSVQRPAVVILLFTLGLMVSVAALWLAPVHHYALLAVCFFTVGFFVFGPQMLIGLAAVECGHKAAAGSISGFLGLFAYLGAALAGAGLCRWSLNATARSVCSVCSRSYRSSDGFIADAADGEHYYLCCSKDKNNEKNADTTLIASGIALATLSGAAHAKGRLVVLCSATNEMCGRPKPSAKI